MEETATETIAPEVADATPEPKRSSAKSAIEAKVREVVDTIVAAAGLELVELRVLRAPRNVFRVLLFIDRPLDQPSLTVDLCASVSRKVGAELEVDDPFPGLWNLEVSSPGMNRVLRGLDDFNAFMGIRARVKVLTAEGSKITWIGELTAADAAGVTLITDGGRPQVVAHEDIERAELDPTIEQWVNLGERREKSAADDGSNDHAAVADQASASEGVSG